MNPVSLLAVIQASIAPVVLISGVGLLLLMLSARLIRMALTLSGAAVAVSGLLITLLFLGLLLQWQVTAVCALLFVAALLCVVLAMFVFLRELSESLVALELSIGPSGH